MAKSLSMFGMSELRCRSIMSCSRLLSREVKERGVMTALIAEVSGERERTAEERILERLARLGGSLCASSSRDAGARELTEDEAMSCFAWVDTISIDEIFLLPPPPPVLSPSILCRSDIAYENSLVRKEVWKKSCIS